MNPQHAMKDPRRRKLLVYGGIAAAILLAVILSRRSAANAAAQQQANAAQPVANPAPTTDLGTGAGGIDYGPQLATLDTDLQTLSDAFMQSQQNAQTPGATPSGGLTDLLNAELAAVNIYQAGQHGPGNRRHTRPQTKPKAKHPKPHTPPPRRPPGRNHHGPGNRNTHQGRRTPGTGISNGYG